MSGEIYKDGVNCSIDTDKALLCTKDGEPDFWVPKSQVSDDSEVYKVGTDGRIIMKGWWAEKFDWEKVGWEAL